jgi:MGT family glycosyltransferase
VAVNTFLFAPESAYGPTGNCIGIGAVLRARGHRVVFAAEASWRDRLTALGFEEDLVDLAPPPQGGAEQDAGQFWKDFIRDTAPEFRKPTIDQLESFMVPTWQALVDGVKFSEGQIRGIVDRVRPDVVVEDNVVCFPALLTSPAPWVRIVSCNPLEVRGEDVPPAYSGYPSDDQSGWESFRKEYDRTHRSLWSEFDAWVRGQGAPALPELEFIHESAHLNLYLYPRVADYTDARPLGPTWHRVESSVRATEAEFALPESIRSVDRPVVYVSLGSLGSADVDLMRRLVDCLSRTPYSFIVSKGPQHTEFELADNMWGAEFLPQPNVIPLCDVVITHGGNNTTTECFHFGKPMVVLPLFWDQYDNAQRVDELGFGVRLDTYRFTDAQMHDALRRVLYDDSLRERLAEAGREIRASDGVTHAADLLERLAADPAHRPVST